MNKNPRHGRPKPEYKASLRQISEEDIQQLVQATITAIIAGDKSLVIATSYIAEFDTDFPRGQIIKRDGLVDYRRIMAHKLLKWLNEKGYSPFNSDDIGYAQRRISLAEKELGSILD